MEPGAHNTDAGHPGALSHVLGAGLVTTTLWFGGVHAVACAVLGLWLLGATLLFVRGRVALGRWVQRWWWAWVLVGAIGVCGALPVGPEARQILQPGLAELVARSTALSRGAPTSFALDAAGALVASGLALYAAATIVLASLAARRPLEAWVIAAGTIVAVLGVAQRATGARAVYWVTAAGLDNPDAPFGPFIYQNHAAVFLAAVLPLAVAAALREQAGLRVLYLMLAALLAACAVATGSRGAPVLLGVVGLAAALAVWGWARGAAVVALAATAFLGARGLPAWDATRVAHWRDATHLIHAAPGPGVGLGSYHQGIQPFDQSRRFTRFQHAHQEYLQAVAELGVPLTLVLLALASVFLLALARRATRGDTGWWGWATSLVVIAVASAWDFPLRAQAIAMLAALALGVCAAGPGSRRRLPGPLLVAVALAGLGLVALGARRNAHATSPEAVLALRPFDTGALMALGEARYRAGDVSGALDAVRLAGEVWPAVPNAFIAEARLHRLSGRLEEARAAYRRALALDQPEVSGRDLLVEALSLDADPTPHLDAILPDRADRRCWGGEVLDGMGRTEAALALLERGAESEDPAFASVCLALLGSHHLRHGRPGQALTVTEGMAPAGCSRERLRGIALTDLGRYDEALPLLEAALVACVHKDAGIRASIGIARLGLGDAAGLPVLERAVEDFPESVRARRALVDAYVALSRSDQALPHALHLDAMGKGRPVDRALIKGSKRDPQVPPQ